MEKLAYILLLIVAGVLFVGLVIGVVLGVVNAFPHGLIALIVLIALSLLFLKALKDRLADKDDRYKDVER
jgi:uncharacterized protein (DUF983 family)